MKKTRLFCIALLLCLFSSAFAQVRKIPSEVTNAFAEKFKGATDVEWKDNVTNFEAEFKLDSYEMSAYYNGKGEWQETDTKMPFADLPAAVKDGFGKSKYTDWKKGEHGYKIEKAKEGVLYRIYVNKGINKKYLYFDETGKLEKEALTI